MARHLGVAVPATADRQGDHPRGDGRRLRARLHRVPGPALERPRPGKGGHPASSVRRRGRGLGAGGLDDVEVCADRHSLRWRQGWSELRPDPDVTPRASGCHPALHRRSRRQHRPPHGHPRPGHVHERGHDGGRLRHLRHDASGAEQSPCRHGQAAQPRRLARAITGDGTGCAPRRRALPGSRRSPRHQQRRGHGRRDPGIRQCRQKRRTALPGRGGAHRRGQRHEGRHLPRRGPRHRCGGDPQGRDRHSRGLSRRRRAAQSRRPRDPVRHPHPGGAGEPDHPRERLRHRHQAHRRSGKRTGDTDRRRHLA